MQSEALRLDGNAAAGQLREIFARDVTGAVATCAGCGASHAIGALVAYGQTMGVILRCPECEKTMLRLVRTPGWLRLDATGMSLLAIAAGAGS
ncbi:MAG TPA: DUF6510 family protein [Gemmatimonadaceae bacterium]|nr:DUF6510 family protein [Gemmatimonadaceae bacterium]